ncbi:MAG: RNA polymerase sigma-70 factor [Saprospiraceae bacterium]
MPSSFSDTHNFEAIFKEYFNPLVNFVNKYLNNYGDSKEVVQMTFVKLWNHRESLDIKLSLRSYLFQMTKNMMIDYIRKNKNHQNNLSLESIDTSQIQYSSEDQLEPYIVRQAVEKVLKTLKPKAREIFIMNKFEGLTYLEISEYLNISKRSVEDNISKIIKILKDELKDHPELF